MPTVPLPRWLQVTLPLISAALFFLSWLGVHHLLPADQKFLLPTPDRVLGAFLEKRVELSQAAGWTTLAALGGFGLAVVISVILSLLLASSRVLRSALYPYLVALQMTPIIIIAPILILWIGAGLLSVILVTFLICFFPLVVNNLQGLLAVEANFVDLFRMGRASRWQELWLLRVPSAAPYFFTGLRIAAVVAPIGALTGDYQVGTLSGGQSGLGIQALLFSARSEIAALYATAALSCLLGFGFVGAIALVSHYSLRRWQGGDA